MGAAERVEVCRPMSLPGIELWSISQRARWTMLHDAYIFGCCDDTQRGPRPAITLRYRGRPLALRGARLLLGAPGEVLRELQVPAGSTFRMIQVFPQALAESLEAPRGQLAPVLDDERLHRLFSSAWRALEAHELDVTQREHHLRAFLLRAFALAHAMSSEDGPPSSTELAVFRARDFIHAHSTDRITLADVARAAGRSIWYLERSFSAHIGLPMHGYLQQVRLTCAMGLLRRGVKPAIVAPQAGFADQPHMTRAFRRWLGVTPRRFQQAERG